jgi:GNAT superfamily N-acetyltransferase
LIVDIESEIWKVRPDLQTRVATKEWAQPPHPRAECAIRTATLADVTAILALLPQLFELPGARPPTYTEERGRTGIRWAVERPDADILLALDGDALVGLASVYADIQSIRFGKRCWLQDLVVSKEARGRGIGKALLDAATQWARERGCTHLELSSGMGRVDAHRFYRREGMTDQYVFERWIR